MELRSDTHLLESSFYISFCQPSGVIISSARKIRVGGTLVCELSGYKEASVRRESSLYINFCQQSSCLPWKANRKEIGEELMSNIIGQGKIEELGMKSSKSFSISELFTTMLPAILYDI